MTTEQRVKRVISEMLGTNESELKNEHRFAEDLGADSLDRVETVMALEEEFEREVPGDATDAFSTVQSVIDYFDSPHR